MVEIIWNKYRTKTNPSEIKHAPNISDVFISKSQIIREHAFYQVGIVNYFLNFHDI